jgi:hypothetical protein
MKKIVLPLVVTLLTAGTIFTSCESPAEKVETAKDNLATAENNLEKARLDSIDAHDRAKAAYLAKITDNENQLADYKVKIAGENKVQREKDERRLANLEIRNAQMKETVNNYEVASLVSWDVFKSEFNRERDLFNTEIAELGKSLADAGKK